MALARPVVPPASAALAGTMSAADKAKLDTLPAPTNGSAALAAAVPLTTTHPSYQATGFAVTLPAAGTYWVALNARFDIEATAGGAGCNFKLRDTTNGADLAGGGGAVYLGASSDYVEFLVGKVVVVVAAGPVTVELYANRQGSATSHTLQSVDYASALHYVRIA